MSEIRLDDASGLLQDLGCATESDTAWWKARKIKACQDFQDQALETAAKFLEAGGFHDSAVESVRSLKNAQPEPEVDEEIKEILPQVMKLTEKLRDHLPLGFGDTNRELDKSAESFVCQCEVKLANIESPKPEPGVDHRTQRVYDDMTENLRRLGVTSNSNTRSLVSAMRDIFETIQTGGTETPEPTGDQDWRDLLVEAVRTINEMRDHLEQGFIGTSHSIGTLLSRCNDKLGTTESP